MNQIEHIMQLADLYSVLFGRYRIEQSALSLSEHQNARMALRDAIEQAIASGEGALQALSNKENIMPITDDHGKALHDQRRIIEQRGKWRLIYDQHQIGNTVHHEFRIQKLTNDIVLYPGITLDEAKKRFAEKVEADNE